MEEHCQVVTHINQNQRYRIVIERAAVKGIDGFKVEANGDDLSMVETDAKRLYQYAIKETEIKPIAP